MKLDYNRLRSWTFPEVVHSYQKTDVILYALGLGAGGDDARGSDELKFVYEKYLVALPTMVLTLGNGEMWFKNPAFKINLANVLHGEQRLTLYKSLPVSGTIKSQMKVEGIFDKGEGRGALVFTSRRIYDSATDDHLATEIMSIFLRGYGGFGGDVEGMYEPHSVPVQREPDDSLVLLTRPDQALLYRLSGDYNPLHIDPEVAESVGFDAPILHGLCTYGFAGRALLKRLCNNDPARLKKIDARFSKPVFPGETLKTEIWHIGEGRAAFQCRVTERDIIVLSNGYCEYIPASFAR